MSGTVTYNKRTTHTWEYSFPLEESPWPVLTKTYDDMQYKPIRLIIAATQKEDERPVISNVILSGPRKLKSGYGQVTNDSLGVYRHEKFPDFVKEILSAIEASF